MRIEKGDGWELRLADWRDDIPVPIADAVIEDPPYGERTHAGQRHQRATDYPRKDRAGNVTHRLSDSGDLGYDCLTDSDVVQSCAHADAACRGWTVSMCSHDLIPAYEAALQSCGRYVFAPIPIVIRGMNVRLAGDGPSNWTVYTVVSRRRAGPKKCWSTKPGAYTNFTEDARVAKGVKGSKPLALMEAIVCDYSDPGDLILDRFAGSGTTGIAAIRQGRRFIGYERKPEHFEIALRRLQGRPAAVEGQEELFG